MMRNLMRLSFLCLSPKMKILLFHVKESCSGRKAGNVAAEQNTRMSMQEKSDPGLEEGQEVDRDRGEGRGGEQVQ